ncbi:MAG: NADH-quinone oxidoreductase subunit J [Desulfobulbaceae bacterium]|nr:NADH-quinone oxidoreductase subunit J [Desulfobulbaceae bacterium]
MNPPISSAEGLAGLVFLVMLAATGFGALIAVNAERTIRAVAGLALCFVGVAGIYYFLQSPFVALMELLIYVGAVCVVLVFAVMLAEPRPEQQVGKRNAIVGGLSFLSASLLTWGLVALANGAAWCKAPMRINEGSMRDLGQSLLTTYSMVFELVSVVLLVAIIGSLVLGRAGRSKA